MARFFTSDLHFGHANIIRYCNRPFRDVQDMNESLIARWNETVGEDDEVWVLGDICMGQIDDSLHIVGRLCGTLHLLAGNHDRPFRNGGPARPEWEQRYREAGFDSIDHGEVLVDVGLAQPVRACHFPYRGDSHDDDRYVGQRPIDDSGPLLHGHTHGQWRQHGLMIDVGVDAWDGRPVADEVVARMIESGQHDLDPLPWRATV